jgi:hypothetical protein
MMGGEHTSKSSSFDNLIGGHMEWFATFFDQHGISLILPIVLIVVVFILLAIRAHQKHLARLEEVKRDIDNR